MERKELEEEITRLRIHIQQQSFEIKNRERLLTVERKVRNESIKKLIGFYKEWKEITGEDQVPDNFGV